MVSDNLSQKVDSVDVALRKKIYITRLQERGLYVVNRESAEVVIYCSGVMEYVGDCALHEYRNIVRCLRWSHQPSVNSP